jgi:3alpha(or 20beta)-hydroxysteroid dehydrogenase
MFSLRNKVTVITGGTSGIGLAAAERFRRAEADVVIAARGDGRAVAERIGAVFIRTDVTVEDDVRQLMDQTAARFGRIDVCINNAGIFTGAERIENCSAETMIRSFDANTLGAFFGMKYAVPHMRRGSVIINTSSIGGVLGAPEYCAYSAAKWALNGLSRVAALEYGPLGIRVNCVCPASVNTPMLSEAANGQAEALISKTTSALGVLIEPGEVAALMHFLAADDCASLTGQSLLLDAGITAGFSEASGVAILKAGGLIPA